MMPAEAQVAATDFVDDPLLEAAVLRAQLDDLVEHRSADPSRQRSGNPRDRAEHGQLRARDALVGEAAAGRVQHQCIDALAVSQPGEHGDGPAHRVADGGEAFDAERIGHGHDIVGTVVETEATSGFFLGSFGSGGGGCGGAGA